MTTVFPPDALVTLVFGIVTRNPEELEWPAFERGFYEVKEVSGRQTDPASSTANMISCHADTVASEDDGLAPVDSDGTPATPAREEFDWGHVCPTHDAYRAGLLDIVERCATAHEDVRIDDVGFPRAGFCRCERCEERFAASDHDDWGDWRADIVTAFVADVRERVPGALSIGVYPNPYPGHLRRRTGLDLDRIEPYVDEVIVPMYDMAYTTTYWLEILADGFDDRLSIPFSIELYAVQVEPDRLVGATEALAPYDGDVFFGYDAGAARGAIRRLRAEEGEGTTFGQPS